MTSKLDWSATQYCKFEAQRTRPSRELLSRVPLDSPARIVDLGCGPGNSTAVLVARYPTARVTGMDSSPDMIVQARHTLPSVTFSVADLRTYSPEQDVDAAHGPVDLFFSNAVLQWLSWGERLRVITRLLSGQASGGVFAFQAPDNWREPVHVAMQETAGRAGAPWAETLGQAKPAREDFEGPGEIYEALRPVCQQVDMWHTTYHQVMENHEAIVEWMKGTGLRPFLNPLPEEQKEGFLEEFLGRMREVYPAQSDGRVLLAYPRLFVVAVRA